MSDEPGDKPLFDEKKSPVKAFIIFYFLFFLNCGGSWMRCDNGCLIFFDFLHANVY
jgi:hypothetical protein